MRLARRRLPICHDGAIITLQDPGHAALDLLVNIGLRSLGPQDVVVPAFGKWENKLELMRECYDANSFIKNCGCKRRNKILIELVLFPRISLLRATDAPSGLSADGDGPLPPMVLGMSAAPTFDDRLGFPFSLASQQRAQTDYDL